MAAGLKVLPLGGYRDAEAKPWVPLGNTGVIRGSERDAQVVADSPLNVLMTPQLACLKHWFNPCSQSELSERRRSCRPFSLAKSAAFSQNTGPRKSTNPSPHSFLPSFFTIKVASICR